MQLVRAEAGEVAVFGAVEVRRSDGCGAAALPEFLQLGTELRIAECCRVTHLGTSPKFIGACMAELILDGQATTVDISPFRPSRFTEGVLAQEHNVI